MRKTRSLFVCYFSLHARVCTTCRTYPWKPEEDRRYTGTGARDNECWERKPEEDKRYTGTGARDNEHNVLTITTFQKS
ncbi:hypothetical protein STEG23_006481, partial [Scotinomys teguina]